MTIQLTPEDEQLIQKRLQTGSFQSIEEVIHDALASQKSEQDWLVQNQAQIQRKIANAVNQLDRGEGIPAEAVRDRLQKRKQAWRSAPASE